MGFDSISGIFYIADQGYAVRFLSAAPDGGRITGFATDLRDENEAVYALRLKSLLELETDGVR